MSKIVDYSRMSACEEMAIQRRYTAHLHRIEKAKAKVDTSSARLSSTKLKKSTNQTDEFWRNKMETIIQSSRREWNSTGAKKSRLLSNKLNIFHGLQKTSSHYTCGHSLARFQGITSLKQELTVPKSPAGMKLPPIDEKCNSKWKMSRIKFLK